MATFVVCLVMLVIAVLACTCVYFRDMHRMRLGERATEAEYAKYVEPPNNSWAVRQTEMIGGTIDLATLDGVHAYLDAYYEESEAHPAVQAEISGVRAQVERAEELRQRIKNLLSANHTVLIPVVNLFDEVVSAVCENVLWLINYQLAGGNALFLDSHGWRLGTTTVSWPAQRVSLWMWCNI